MFARKKFLYPLYTLLFIATMFVGALVKDTLEQFYQSYLSKKPHTSEYESHERYLQLTKKMLEEFNYPQAYVFAQKALAIKPDDVQTLQIAGNACLMASKTDQALDIFKKLMTKFPQSAPAHFNYGYVYFHQGKPLPAIEHMEKAIALDPNHQMAQTNRAESLLKIADFQKGVPAFASHWNNRFVPGAWDNIDFKNKTVVLFDVQGIGDSLQFVRYLKLLKQRGAQTIVHTVNKAVIPLYERCSFIDKVLFKDQPVPKSDYQAPLMALFVIFNTNQETIPCDIPYITADSKLIAYWKNKLAQDHNLKVGISWHADQKCEYHQPVLKRKSVDLKDFINILRIPGVSFYSLQKFEGVQEMAQLPRDIAIHDFGNDFDTTHGRFMDTAAVMMNLDLIISVDTSIVHLAGALGRPVWMLLNFPGDWRWMLDRDDSPWYPTMKIFRKNGPADWQTPLKQIESNLIQLVAKKNSERKNLPLQQKK